MSCPRCRAVDLNEISLQLRGRSVTMHSCSRCENRWWDEDGQRVAFHHVLRLAAHS